MYDRGVTVTVERPSGFNKHGEPLTPTTFTVAGCVVYPIATEERYGGRDTIMDLVRLLAPTSAGIRTTDKVILPNGKRYDVSGEPGDYQSPFSGWNPGSRFTLQEVTG